MTFPGIHQSTAPIPKFRTLSGNPMDPLAEPGLLPAVESGSPVLLPIHCQGGWGSPAEAS
jgi:hypothetical protein